jgi:lipopolysaccharide transport system ATP-binding protein
MTRSNPKDNSVLIRAEGLGKRYARTQGAGSGLRMLAAAWNRTPPADAFVALDDVSFEVRRGESLAIVGENGAGKSTLLKLIAGVVKPTQGSVVVNGSMSALLELGSGFHPEYTGAQNIELSAALLGIPTAQLAEKREQIIAFADIGDALNKPIKTYSSGMVVRLGFAIATAVNPDLLITDEVMAVGDEAFQKKCIRWVEGYLARGGTLLLVSHSMYHVQKLCAHAIWLEHGRVRMQSDAMTVSQAYLAVAQEKDNRDQASTQKAELTPDAHGLYRVETLTVNGEASLAVMATGESLSIAGDIISPDGRVPHVMVGLVRVDGVPVYGTGSELEGVVLQSVAPHRYAFSLRYDNVPLLPGQYTVRVHAMDPEGMRLFDTVERSVQVSGRTRELGVVRLPHRWL